MLYTSARTTKSLITDLLMVSSILNFVLFLGLHGIEKKKPYFLLGIMVPSCFRIGFVQLFHCDILSKLISTESDGTFPET